MLWLWEASFTFVFWVDTRLHASKCFEFIVVSQVRHTRLYFNLQRHKVKHRKFRKRTSITAQSFFVIFRVFASTRKQRISTLSKKTKKKCCKEISAAAENFIFHSRLLVLWEKKEKHSYTQATAVVKRHEKEEKFFTTFLHPTNTVELQREKISTICCVSYWNREKFCVACVEVVVLDSSLLKERNRCELFLCFNRIIIKHNKPLSDGGLINYYLAQDNRFG